MALVSPTKASLRLQSRSAWGLSVVTGASSGIGREIAYHLAGQEVPLLLSGRNCDALAETADRCAALGAKAEVVRADFAGLLLAESVTEIAARAQRMGGARALVAAAGLGWAGNVEDTPLDVVERLAAVNVTAPVMLGCAVLPQMLASGGGRIVFVGSIAGAVGVAGEAVYSATKAALIGFADALRAEVAPRGVSVTVAMPGPVDTAFFDRRGAPYGRSRPAPLPAAAVARSIVESATAGSAEKYIPQWLSVAARVRGTAPAVYRRLAGRWG